MSVSSFKDLDVWKKGVDIAEHIYDLSKKFPKEEKYGLTSQVQRAAVSIPSNIAEGFARWRPKEFQRYCHFALGACAELETQLIIAYRQKYISEAELAFIEEYLDHESRMLWRLIRNL